MGPVNIPRPPRPWSARARRFLRVRSHILAAIRGEVGALATDEEDIRLHSACMTWIRMANDGWFELTLADALALAALECRGNQQATRRWINGLQLMRASEMLPAPLCNSLILDLAQAIHGPGWSPARQQMEDEGLGPL